MIDDPVLVDDWHPVATCEQLAAGRPIGARLLGEDIVVWQAGERPLAWQDLCVHRGTRLSLGRVEGARCDAPITAGSTTTTASASAFRRCPTRRRRARRGSGPIARL